MDGQLWSDPRMPELPDVVVYLEALDRHVVGETLEDVRLSSPFLLRTVDPPLKEAAGKEVFRLHTDCKEDQL